MSSSRPPHHDILDWYRRLIDLRRSMPELRDGRLDRTVVTVENEHSLVVRRGRVTVACNLGEHATVIEAGGALSMRSEERVAIEAGRLHLPPDSVAVLTAGGGGGSG